MRYIGFAAIYVSTIASWEFGKWLAKRLVWKTVLVEVPGVLEGKMTLSVRRSLITSADQVIDNIMTSQGMKRAQ